jgi:hypothetical protein
MCLILIFCSKNLQCPLLRLLSVWTSCHNTTFEGEMSLFLPRGCRCLCSHRLLYLFLLSYFLLLNLDSHSKYAHSCHTGRENTIIFCLFLDASFRNKVYAQVTERWFERRYSLKTFWPISKSKIKCAPKTQELSVWILYGNPLPWSDRALTGSVPIARRASVCSGLVFNFNGRSMCRSFQIQEM